MAGYTWVGPGLISRWGATTNGPQSQFYQFDARGCAGAVLDAGTGWLDSVTTVLNACQAR